MASQSRQNISSGAPWESIVGYSRAVRLGNMVVVAGTTAADEKGQVVGVGDPYTQTIYILEKIKKALASYDQGFTYPTPLSLVLQFFFKHGHFRLCLLLSKEKGHFI